MDFQMWQSTQPGETTLGVIYYVNTCAECEYRWQAVNSDSRYTYLPYICKRSTLQATSPDYEVNENGG